MPDVFNQKLDQLIANSNALRSEARGLGTHMALWGLAMGVMIIGGLFLTFWRMFAL